MSKTKHENIVEFEVSGDYALFSDILTRPGGEKFSYPVPTYEALKGILQSVYWKPTIIWVIDAVRVMNRITTEHKGIRPIKYGGGNDLAMYTYLRDVRYQVRAHFDWNDNRSELSGDRNENKHHNIAKRMIERGGRRDVFLGTRECSGSVEPCKFGEGEGYYDNCEEMPFGMMLHGITYADEAELEEDKGYMTVRLWQPKMINGVIRFPHPNEFVDKKAQNAEPDDVVKVKRHLHKMEIKKFGREYNNFTGTDELGLLDGGDEV